MKSLPHFFSCLALLGLAGSPAASPAVESKPTGPAAVVRFEPQTQTARLDSSFEGVELRLTDPETGEDLNSAEKLYQHGWKIGPDGYLRSRMDGFYETIPLFDEMGRPIRIEVTGLYPGAQHVKLHYFSQPFAFGSTWNTAMNVRLGGAKWKSFKHDNGELIRGIGHHDQTSLYRGEVGVAGEVGAPENSVVVELRKAKWSKQATVRAIRIGTEVDPNAALTGMARPEQTRVRERLAELADEVVSREGFFAAALPPTTKVKPKSFASIDPAELSAEARLASGRNAYANFQLLVYSPKDAIEDLTWEVEPFVSTDGGSRDFEAMVAPVGFVHQPSDPGNTDSYGYLPDPLLNFLDTLEVREDDAQTLWVRLRVPSEAEPGVYRSTVRLQADGGEIARIPVSLTVWDFEHPEWPFLPVVTGVGKHTEFEMGYGINPASIYWGDSAKNVFNMPREKSLAILNEWRERGVSALNLRYFTYRHQAAPGDEELKALVDDIEEHYERAKEAGLGEEAYVYMFDEAKPGDYPAMAKVSSALRERMPDLRLMTTAYWGRDQSFGVEAGVAIDTWVPIVQHFRNPDLAEIGRAKGRDIWWYACNYPRPPMPNIHLDNSGMETRMLMGLMPHAFEVDGFLYYATTSWRGGQKPIESGPYTDWEPQRGYSHGGWYQRGPDGKPIPSMRMEIFRDGLEDYNLVEMAIRRRAAMDEAGLEVAPAMSDLLGRLRGAPNPYVTSVLEYTRDYATLEDLREKLAAFIESADAKLNRL